MLLLENERYLNECSLKLGSTPTDAPFIKLDDCIQKLELYVKAKKSVYLFNDDRACLRITEMEVTDYSISFLLLFSSKDISNPAFVNLETGKIREEKKLEGEGVAVTSHLVVSRITSGMPNAYDAVLEEVPGVTRNLVGRTLTHILKECTNLSFNVGDIQKKCRPITSLDLNCKHTLKELMTRGTLTGFTIRNEVLDTGLDESSNVRVKENNIVLVAKKCRGDTAVSLISDIWKQYPDSKCTAHYKDENKRSRSLKLDCARAEMLENLNFSKNSKAIVGKAIKQCQEEFHEELNSKMLNVLNLMKE